MNWHTHPTSRRAFMAASATGMVSMAMMRSVGNARAQKETPTEDEIGGPPMPPLPEGASIVADGLWNPGNITFGDDGTLYIAEQGVFAESDETDEQEMATPLPDGSLPTGPLPIVPPQVSRITPEGQQDVITTEAGGVGIAFSNGTIYVSLGGGSVGSGFLPQPTENTISAIDSVTGQTRLVASIGPYEVENNPDGTDINPNLYGMAATEDGVLFVADAGGNAVYRVDPSTDSFDLFAVVPDLAQLTGATPTPEEIEAMGPDPRQSVPTSVVIGGDGNMMVVLLSLAWIGPSVLTYTPEGDHSASVSGLSTIVNATIGPDGLLYVTQLSADMESNEPAPGAVLRVNADGSIESVVDGLFFPHGIVFDAAGDLFVVANTLISGPDAPLGQVLKISGIATPGA